MPNAFNPYTPQQIGEVAVGLATSGFRLAKVVAKFGPNDFKEGRGDTVFLNVPGALTAHSRSLGEVTTSIVLDSLTESQEPVKLNVHAYSAVGLSEYDLSLGLQDFSKQVLLPQVDAVVNKIETAIEVTLSGLTEDTTIAYDPTDPVKVFSAGRRALSNKGIDVSSADLVAIVGANIVEDLFDSGALDFDKTGAADALRSGTIGRVRGFEAIESGRVGDDEVIFMTRTSLYLAHRAPAVPLGATYGETVIQDEISLRYLRDYDVTKTQDRSLVSTFVGVGVMPLYKVERTEDVGKQGDVGYVAGSAVVTEVAGGAVVKVITTA
jgi:hypothetical protein